jgi:cation diffusion facilitator family transporter
MDGSPDGSRRAIAAAFLANLGIALAKLVGFLVTGAASLLAEAIHSAADTVNEGLLFLGDVRSRRAPDEAHPFGFGRERYFWPFIVALVLFAGGGLFALVEAVEKLISPHDLESLPWAVGILVVALALEAWSLRTAVHESRAVKGDESWRGFVLHSKRAELTVVLLEDTGALIGLGFALAGVALAAATGNSRFDALGSLGIGVLLVVIAGTLAVKMKSLLIGEGADRAQVAAIRRVVEGAEHVRRLARLRTLQLSPDELLVAADVEMEATLPAAEVARTIDEIEAAIRAQVPEATVVYIEPDLGEHGPLSGRPERAGAGTAAEGRSGRARPHP